MYLLPKLAKVFRNPAHVPEHLTDHLVGLTAFFEFNYYKGVRLGVLSQNVDDACVFRVKLLSKRAFIRVRKKNKLLLENRVEIGNYEILEVFLQNKLRLVFHTFLRLWNI